MKPTEELCVINERGTDSTKAKIKRTSNDPQKTTHTHCLAYLVEEVLFLLHRK
jgi:hypothetical protein